MPDPVLPVNTAERPVAEPILGSSTDSEQKRSRETILTVAIFAAVWLVLFNELRYTWTADEQYGFGWFVPLLGLGLLWRRWTSRPAPFLQSPSPALRGAVLLIFLSLLPLRLVLAANPYWPGALWVHALLLVALSCCALYAAGGSRWLKHFAFPVAFLLVAVPWPFILQGNIVPTLRKLIAAATVEIIWVFNIPALQSGNVIELATGTVGIDEACSGVRSLQTGIMASLFLGELYGFTFRPRFLLPVLGVLTAIVGNLGRTLILVWVTQHKGLDEMHHWHDLAGLAASVTSLGGVWGIALILRWRSGARTLNNADLSLQSDSAMPFAGPANPGDSCPVGVAPTSLRVGSFPLRLLVFCAIWIFFTELTVEAWYRSHENRLVPKIRWTMSWPETDAGFQTLSIPNRTKELLQFDEGWAATWQDGQGNSWLCYRFRWNPNQKALFAPAWLHTPEICLKAAGGELKQKLGQEFWEINGVQFAVNQYLFELGTRASPLSHVFYIQWQDYFAQDRNLYLPDGSRRSKFLNVLHGRRPNQSVGQEVIEIILQGPGSTEDAATLVRAGFKELIRRIE